MVPSGLEPWTSGHIDPGEVFSFRFDQPGSHSYFCRYHEQAQMIGVVVVEEA